jgi:WD40 repeat protein
VKSKILFLLILVFTATACGPFQPTPVLVNGATITPTPIPLSQSVEPITHDNVNRIEALGQLASVDPISTVFAYDLSPDGTRLAGLNNNLLVSWDLVSGTLVFSTARQNATRVYYSPDKTEIYTVDETGIVNVINDRGIFQTQFQGHPLYNTPVLTFYRDDGWLALGGTDGTVKVWDTATRTSLATLEGHTARVNAVVFSSDGTLLATGGDEGVIKIWDWETRTIAQEINAGTIPTRLAFSPDATQIAVGTVEDIRLYNVSDGIETAILATGERGSSEVMLYSPNGEFLVNGGGIPDMQVWNPHGGALVALIPGFGNQRLSADFSPDSSMLLTSRTSMMESGETALWDMTQITNETINQATLPLNVTTILSVSWTDDSRLMVFLDAMGPIYVWGISPRSAMPTQTPVP